MTIRARLLAIVKKSFCFNATKTKEDSGEVPSCLSRPKKERLTLIELFNNSPMFDKNPEHHHIAPHADAAKDQSPRTSTVVGRPIILALEDVDGTPSFLEKALCYVEDYGVNVEGILRQAADVDDVERRIREYEQGKTEFGEDEDGHVIGDCIKFVLRVPASCCAALLEAYNKTDGATRASAIRSAICETFPEPNRRLLQRILIMMEAVAEKKAVNRMSVSAVAACMSPLLLGPLLAGEVELAKGGWDMGGDTDGSFQLLQAVAAAKHAQAICITLVEEYDKIFGEEDMLSDVYSDSDDYDSESASDEYYEEDEYSDDDNNFEGSGSYEEEESEEHGSSSSYSESEDDDCRTKGSVSSNELSNHSKTTRGYGGEKLSFETKALHLISKAIDYNLRRAGILKPPSPARERHVTPPKREGKSSESGPNQPEEERFNVNSGVATPNLNNMQQGGSHLGQFQFPPNSHQLNQSPVNSRGSGNKGSQASESSSFNSSSDKEEDLIKMHEIQSRSKRENSNESYQGTTTRLRMWIQNVDEMLQGSTRQSTSLQHLQGSTRDRNQWRSIGHTGISGQALESSAEFGKWHVSDREGISKGSYDMRSNMAGGLVPNMFASFNGPVGQPSSQDMLEPLHKVDQVRNSGSERFLNSPQHILSSEMPGRRYSDESVRAFQRSQSSDSRGLGLNPGLPSQQRSPLSNTPAPPLLALEQSLYGVSASKSEAVLNPYPYAAMDKAPAQQGNQYAGVQEQGSMHDGTSVSRQGIPGNSLFEHMSGQDPNGWINTEQIQQLNSNHQTQCPQDFIGFSEMTHDKLVTEADTFHGSDSLDPEEEKNLFGSDEDENIWDAFGSDINMDGGDSNLLDDNEFTSGLPSLQSGSWSALMQSAVAEASSCDAGLQEDNETSVRSDAFFIPRLNHPRYMANTQSFSAKQRSHCGVRMQKSCWNFTSSLGITEIKAAIPDSESKEISMKTVGSTLSPSVEHTS